MSGLHFDELWKVRLLDPDASARTQELKDECKNFTDKMDHFQKLVDGFIDVVNKLAKSVEEEKLLAIGSRNSLKSMEKHRESVQQQLGALIMEKRIQLERYRIEYESLLKAEAEQKDFINQLLRQS
ncbi:intraflagellar transport protein 20 homolog [Oscarella lobularis]|uniref:intraflagellar transport protein 20 homolog n=1 Tax=Oscarella lobularis TaxID=121494 RepID=UPI00331413CE